MKRVFSLMLAAMLAIALTACGNAAEEQNRGFETGDVQTLVEGGVFSEELEELDADVAFALYHLGDCGLEREALVEAAVVRSAGATCEEAAVLIFADKNVAEQAEDALEDYLEGQVENNANYRPDEIPKLENAILEDQGESVVLVVAQNTEKAQKILGLD